MKSDPATRDCEHRYCRILALAVQRGRALPRRCRKRCPVAQGLVTLDQLPSGQAGRIVRVGGRPSARRRLLELGVVRGETISLARAAPLGDPLEFVIKGYHLSLRKREAATIMVETDDAPGCAA
jgi:ferrous iron transport protein A